MLYFDKSKLLNQPFFFLSFSELLEVYKVIESPFGIPRNFIEFLYEILRNFT